MNKIKKLALAFFFQITIMVFASVSVCAQTNVPKDIPLPLQAEGWEGVTVSRLCLKVEQSYPQIEDEFSQPIAEKIQSVLKRIGVQVMDEGESCDATLTFTVTLEASDADYRGVGRLYTGASAHGQLELAGEGRPTVNVSVSQYRAPTNYANGQSPRSLRGAPFRRVWNWALVDGLSKLWGIEVLIGALNNEMPWEMRSAVVSELREIGDPRAVEPLTALLNDEIDVGIQQRALWALGEIGDPRAVESLIAFLNDKDKDSQVRMDAAHALRDIGDPRAVEPLIAVLKDESSVIQSDARGALRTITGRDFGTDEAKWRKWWDENKEKMLKDR